MRSSEALHTGSFVARRRRRQAAATTVLLLAIVGTACSYTSQLPLPRHQPVSSEILWDNGTVLTTVHAQENRDPVTLRQMAPTLPTAVIAIEDERFYDHPGVDARGVLRALTHDVSNGDTSQGGSTITQQYVRAVMLGHEKNLERKLREAVMAVQLEQRYSKQTILEQYLNIVYFGEGAYGVEAAAEQYFAKHAHDLDLAQSALLAGVIRSPTDYDPDKYPARALARRNEVLDKLAQLKREPASAIARARAEPLGVLPPRPDPRTDAPHFIDEVRRFIESRPEFGATPDARQRSFYEGGLRIKTTLDPNLQALAVQSIGRILEDPATDPSGALVAMDPKTGEVKAYVGGEHYYDKVPGAKVDLAGGGCNKLIDGKTCRQAGSTFKAFVLAAALQAGIPLSRTYNAPPSLTINVPGQPPWLVNNYDGKGEGRMNLVDATVNSVNTVYAQLIMDLGPQLGVSMARQLGVQSPLSAVPSAVLGSNPTTPLEMASGYSSFAGDGMHAPPVIVSQVTTSDGTVLYQAPERRTRVLSANIARTVNGVLQQVVTRGTGINARIGRAVAGKTGTSDNWADAWFVGYTPELVTAVWVGFPGGEISMRPDAEGHTRITVQGGSWPAEIWQQFEGPALAEIPPSTFPLPGVATPDGGVAPSTTTMPPAPTGAVPSVQGLDVADATAALVGAGYRVSLDEVSSRSVPSGVVISQDPPAGSHIGVGGTVTVQVSTGAPAQVTVPNVLGALTDVAAGALRGTGLDIDVIPQSEPPPVDPSNSGRIWKQSPISGSRVDAGSTITVWVDP
ncbi:MAG TPA: transglycosylase domain-containing protein [Acidimicrobiia bacterium]